MKTVNIQLNDNNVVVKYKYPYWIFEGYETKYDGSIDDLTFIDISTKKLYFIPNEIYDLYNLQTLMAHNNNISIVPENINKLINLTYLSLDYNNLDYLPENICELINLKELSISNNKIKYLPKNIHNLINLKNFDMQHNIFEQLPDNFCNLTNLQRLDLSYNKLNELPENFNTLTNLKKLDIDSNKIKTIPYSFSYLINLKELCVDNNEITKLPPFLSNLINCHDFSYRENPIDFIPINVQRWLNKQKSISNFYNDNQNIHNNNIQESFRKSVYSLLNDNDDTEFSIENVINDNMINDNVKSIIIEYCNDETLHSVLNVNFLDIFKKVWERINQHKDKKELKNILNSEMLDSECKCFIGRITRLVNVLNGFYDDIDINISDKEQIGTIISNMMQNNKDKNEIQNELAKRGFTQNVIDEWLEHLQ
jgi:Leucine-rich repeat (LRR) protein